MSCRDSIGLQGQASGQVNIDSSMPAAELLKPLAHKILMEGFTSPEVSSPCLDLIFRMTRLLLFGSLDLIIISYIPQVVLWQFVSTSAKVLRHYKSHDSS